MDRKTIGKQGEEMAAEWLRQKGYEILETNFRKRSGEIDIIARAPEGNYVFAEVKTRSSNTFGYPEEAVDARKIHKMFVTAEQWMKQNGIETDRYQLDVIAIETGAKTPRITHLENIG